MKFRDPGTGEVFKDIENSVRSYCAKKTCVSDCLIHEKSKHISPNMCVLWSKANPTEAARLMGYEVIDNETSIDIQQGSNKVSNKPLSEWTLGEIKANCPYTMAPGEDYGAKCEHCRFGNVCGVGADEWDLTDKPRWTEQEIEDTKVLRRMYDHVLSIERDIAGCMWLRFSNDAIGAIRKDMFPSLAPGQSITLDEIIRGDT